MATSTIANDVVAAGVSYKRYAIAAAALGVLLLCLLAAPRLLYALSHETTDDAYVDAYPAVVSARVAGTVVDIPVHPGQFVKRGTVLARLDDTDASSEVLRLQQALASARADLEQAKYEAADAFRHRSGELLRSSALAAQSQARSDSYRLQAQSSAQDASAMRDAIAQAKAAYDAALAAVPAAKTRLETAQAALARMQNVIKEGYVSTAQLEAAQNDAAQAQSAYQASLAAVQSARADYQAAQAKASAQTLQSQQLSSSAAAEAQGADIARVDAMESSTDSVAAKQAAVDSRAATVTATEQALKLAQYKLSETVLRSPVDGYVAARPAAVGQLLQNGDPAVVVMPTSDLFVTANFKETQFSRIRQGAEADVHIDSYPGVTFHGHVDALGAASQSALSITPNTQVPGNFVKITQRVPVRIMIDRVDGKLRTPLRPGMSAEVSVTH